MQVRRGKEKESFIDALKAETARHRGTAPHRERNYAYVDRGYYAEQIRHIWRLFPVRQTLFIKTDDLRITPEQTIQALFSFLGVAPLPVSQSILLNKGGYEDRPSPEEHAFLLDTFEFEIRAVERLLGWDCSSWLC
jgi:hypothetical protein